MMFSRILGRLSPRAWVARIAREEIYAERRESNLRAVKEMGRWYFDRRRTEVGPDTSFTLNYWEDGPGHQGPPPTPPMPRKRKPRGY